MDGGCNGLIVDVFQDWSPCRSRVSEDGLPYDPIFLEVSGALSRKD
jgi:hypothetical protein